MMGKYAEFPDTVSNNKLTKKLSYDKKQMLTEISISC